MSGKERMAPLWAINKILALESRLAAAEAELHGFKTQCAALATACRNSEAKLAEYRDALEKIVEMDEHGQSCRWFCDKKQPCDCHVSIAKAALKEPK